MNYLEKLGAALERLCAVFVDAIWQRCTLFPQVKGTFPVLMTLALCALAWAIFYYDPGHASRQDKEPKQ